MLIIKLMAEIVPLRTSRDATAEDWVWLIELVVGELVSAAPATRAKLGARLIAKLDYLEVDTFLAPNGPHDLRQQILARVAGRLTDQGNGAR